MRRAIEWAILAGGVASLGLAVTATVARAETSRVWFDGFHRAEVSIGAPEVPGAVATVTFHNDHSHQQDELFTLTWQGIEVVVFYKIEIGGLPDRIDVAPPDGMVAEPPFIIVAEGATGQIHIFAAAPGA